MTVFKSFRGDTFDGMVEWVVEALSSVFQFPSEFLLRPRQAVQLVLFGFRCPRHLVGLPSLDAERIGLAPSASAFLPTGVNMGGSSVERCLFVYFFVYTFLSNFPKLGFSF